MGTTLRTLLATMALGVIAAAGATALQSAPTAQATGCTVRSEFDRTVTELGTDPARWSVEKLHAKPMTIRDANGHVLAAGTPIGYAVAGRVHISDAVACWMVPSIVHHEWMHLQPQPQHIDAAQAELIADCGSQLLGSTYTPYLDRVGGCPPVDRLQAALIIDQSPDRGTMTGSCVPGHCPIRKAWLNP